MTRLCKEAARERYLYNRKYQDRYWEKKAAEKRIASRPLEAAEAVTASRIGQTDDPVAVLRTGKVDGAISASCTVSTAEPVSVSRLGKTDERYIAELEQSNKVLNRENRRLVRLLHGYQAGTAQPAVQ